MTCIIVNCRVKSVDAAELSYDDVVMLAFGSVLRDPTVLFTITCHWGRGAESHSKSLLPGERIAVVPDMMFCATITSRA